jgi:hypothetical protein
MNPETGKIYNHTNKDEVISTKTMVPSFCPTWMSDPIKLWGKVEATETRCDAQIFRELEFALIHELTLEESIEIIEQFIDEQFISKGMCASYSIHKKDGNWHCHVMLTTRNIDYDEDNNAYFGKKNRDWNSISLVPKWRKAWADLNNSSLSDNGFNVQISEKSNAERGLDAIPTKHIGPEFTSRKNEAIAKKRQSKINSNKKVKELNAKRAIFTATIKAEDAVIHAELVTDELLNELNGISELVSNGENTTIVSCETTLESGLIATSIADNFTKIPNAEIENLIKIPELDDNKSLSAEEIEFKKYMLSNVPAAKAIFNELKNIKAALGRAWNWGTFQSVYQKKCRGNRDIRTAIYANELIFLMNKAPEKVALLNGLLDKNAFNAALSVATSFLQFNNHESLQKLNDLASAMPVVSNTEVSALIHEVVTSELVTPPLDIPVKTEMSVSPYADYTKALGSYAHLVTDIEQFVNTLGAIADAADKEFNADILQRRINRIEYANLNPTSQQDLKTELLSREFLFIAKNRPTKLQDCFDLLSDEDRAFHTEFLINNSIVRSKSAILTFEHAVMLMPANEQMEVQARYSLKAALSDFQLADYENRKNYLVAMGKNYTWSEFQSDINRLNTTDNGWLKTWWQEKIDVSFGANAEMLMKHLPAWFYVESPKETKYYPISVRPSKPRNELLESYIANLKPTPENSYILSANGLTMTVNDYTQIEQFGIERGLRVGEVKALQIEYWNQAGFADWRRDVLKHLTTFNVPESEVNYKLLRESFGKRDSVDAAEDLAKRLGYVQPDSAYEDDQPAGLVNASDIRQNTVRSLINRAQVWPKNSPWYTEPDAPYPRSTTKPDDDI